MVDIPNLPSVDLYNQPMGELANVLSRYLGLPMEYFSGMNFIFYFFLPLATGIGFMYQLLFRIRLFHTNTVVRWIFSIIFTIPLLWLGKTALFITVPGIIILSVRRLTFKIILLVATFYILFTVIP
jgi:energy-converting hydrogenase Eha subunit A